MWSYIKANPLHKAYDSLLKILEIFSYISSLHHHIIYIQVSVTVWIGSPVAIGLPEVIRSTNLTNKTKFQGSQLYLTKHISHKVSSSGSLSIPISHGQVIRLISETNQVLK